MISCCSNSLVAFTRNISLCVCLIALVETSYSTFGGTSLIYISGGSSEVTEALSAALINDKSQIAVLKFSPDRNSVAVYDTESLGFLYAFESPKPEPMLKAIFDPQSSRMAYGIARKAYLFDIVTREVLFDATEDFDIDRGVQIADGGSRFMLHDLAKTRVKVYDTQTKSVLLDESYSDTDTIGFFLSSEGDRLVVLRKVTEFQSSPFGPRLVTVGFKTIEFDLDQNALATETMLDIDPSSGISFESLMVHTSEGYHIVTLAPRFLFSSRDEPVEFIVSSYSMETGGLAYSSSLFLDGDTRGFTRFFRIDEIE